MRAKPLLSRFRDLKGGDAAGLALLFLHELSSSVYGHPPREAHWQHTRNTPARELGQTLDRACAACIEQWPDQLDGFLPNSSLADESPAVLRSTLDAIEVLSNSASATQERATLLGDVFQETRALSSKQARGAFFTPWRVTVAIAEIVGPGSCCEEWVLDPACGGAALLLAYLDRYRARHGALASRAVTLVGVDIDHASCMIARASLLVAGADACQFWIFHGNSLAQPIVGRDRHSGKLRHLKFTVTVANPPFGQQISMQSLQHAAEQGPLEIPGHVLNRQLPAPAAIRAAPRELPAKAA
jgi:type I restriction-modification system DNA methylase subunit